MSKELDEVILLGDGVLVKKAVRSDKIGSLHLPSGSIDQMLPTLDCEIVKVGPGDTKPLAVEVGDVACIPVGPQYPELKFDGNIYYILAQHNILYVRRKNA